MGEAQAPPRNHWALLLEAGGTNSGEANVQGTLPGLAPFTSSRTQPKSHPARIQKSSHSCWLLHWLSWPVSDSSSALEATLLKSAPNNRDLSRSRIAPRRVVSRQLGETSPVSLFLNGDELPTV